MEDWHTSGSDQILSVVRRDRRIAGSIAGLGTAATVTGYWYYRIPLFVGHVLIKPAYPVEVEDGVPLDILVMLCAAFVAAVFFSGFVVGILTMAWLS